MTAIGEDWAIVFVTTFLLSPKTISGSKFMMTGARGSPPDLPAELWMYIHRLALSDISPLAKLHAQDEIIRYIGPEHPMSDKDLKPFFKAARSLQRVCRLWAKLAQDLFALLQPEIAILVRNVRLSPTRFHHNEFMLRHCGPHINVLVQPEFPRSERLYTAALDTPLPPLLSLTRVYWIETAWSAPLLRAVLAAAPNIQHLSLSSSPSIGTGLSAATLPVFPPLPRLQSLVLLPLTPSCVHAILHATNLAQLTHLTIAPAHLEWPALPVLPALRTLTLFDDRAPRPRHLPPRPAAARSLPRHPRAPPRPRRAALLPRAPLRHRRAAPARRARARARVRAPVPRRGAARRGGATARQGARGGAVRGGVWGAGARGAGRARVGRGGGAVRGGGRSGGSGGSWMGGGVWWRLGRDGGREGYSMRDADGTSKRGRALRGTWLAAATGFGLGSRRRANAQQSGHRDT
ncbi:hypothetical protein B0H14DRAFT_3874642 [Mycena olivaceomarginata]|nr:hypothetical protein B0H14DRAFT_3874642 [Mycena olivaceomarginata]